MLAHANAFLGEIPAQIEETYRPARSTRSAARRGSKSRAARARAHATSTEEVRAVIARRALRSLRYPNSVCAHPDPRDGGKWETVASAIDRPDDRRVPRRARQPVQHAYEPLPWNLYA